MVYRTLTPLMYRMFPLPWHYPPPIPTVLLFFCSFFLFYFILQIVYNLNVDPIVYLSILIYPWSTNPPVNPDHRDREILKSSNHQILLCEEGDSLTSQDWPLRLPQSSSPISPVQPIPVSHPIWNTDPSNHLRDCWGTQSRQSYAQFQTQRLHELGSDCVLCGQSGRGLTSVRGCDLIWKALSGQAWKFH